VPKMSEAEAFAFIAEMPARTAKLASVMGDGSPHVAPVWVALDGRDLLFNTGAGTIKGRALRRDPRVAMCFEDDRPPFSFVSVRGIAAITEDPDELVHWASIIGGRYMGAARAEEYGRRNGVPGELLVRVSVTHVTGERDLAD
jgi:PPOX class probable F420-dependent enzyme